jgi:rhamnosyltransferase
MKISGTIILYNPVEKVISNIKSYINDIDFLYVVDNSDKPNEDIVNKIKEISNLEYIYNNGNIGIAKALNIAINKSIENNYDFILTMDQDSTPDPNMLKNMKEFIKNTNVNDIGIIAPFHFVLKTQKIDTKNLFKEVNMTMTSGNLVNLNILSKVGGFIDELFIDHVDHEYCLRLRYNGYKVIQLNNAILYHELGELKYINLLFKKKAITSHSPLRMYYIFRNGFYVNNLYKSKLPDFHQYFIKLIINEILYTIIIEKNKLKRFKLMLKGFLDYKKNKLGKYV